MEVYKQTVETLLAELSSHPTDGLSSVQVRQARERYGENLLVMKGKPLWRKLLEPFLNVFIAILLVAVVISVLAGEHLDGAIVAGVIFLNAIIFWVQQYSTERVLRALKRHDQQQVTVWRNGRQVMTASTELVPGDIIELLEGQKIPADARILHAENLAINESVLTGEAVPVHKHSAHIAIDTKIYNRHNMVYQGTFVTAGTARVVVVATGNATEFGRLARLAQPLAETPLQKKINALVSLIVKIIFGIALTVFALNLIRGATPSEALRFMLTLTVSSVPEGLPISLTIIMVIAMRKMAKQQALVRSLHAIENLGLITVIATDKTGTLTENILRVQRSSLAAGVSEPMLKLYAYLSALVHEGKAHDPLDSAFASWSEHKRSPRGMKLIRQFSFVQVLRMSGVLWREGSKYELYIKGSPEHILRKSALTKSQLHQAESVMHQLAAEGYRVIALASSNVQKPIEKLEQIKSKFTFRGFLAIADSLRPEAAEAVMQAQSAGISVKMITGDHFETAFHIGKQLGMAQHPKDVFNAEASKSARSIAAKVVSSHTVFARILPEDKFKILQSLKRNQITAMTGDGVNDVPALTSSHVGVAMGSGADIAKEAGDIVLLDDNFKTIIAAIREGRIVYTNIRKMVFYLFSTTLGETLTMIGALLIGLPLPVTAIQILWINLVTDTLMVLPLGLEPAEDDVMKHSPRKPKAPLLDTVMIQRLILMGITLSGVTLFVLARNTQVESLAYAQAIAFTMLVTGQWAKALVARSESQSIIKRMLRPNIPQLFFFVVAISLQLAVLFSPLGTIFDIPQLTWHDVWPPVLAIVLVVLIVGEGHKLAVKLFARRQAYLKQQH